MRETNHVMIISKNCQQNHGEYEYDDIQDLKGFLESPWRDAVCDIESPRSVLQSPQKRKQQAQHPCKERIKCEAPKDSTPSEATTLIKVELVLARFCRQKKEQKVGVGADGAEIEKKKKKKKKKEKEKKKKKEKRREKNKQR